MLYNPAVAADILSIAPPLLSVLFLAMSFVTATAQIPTPVSILGHNPGDDFYLAEGDDAIRGPIRYFATRTGELECRSAGF